MESLATCFLDYTQASESFSTHLKQSLQTMRSKGRRKLKIMPMTEAVIPLTAIVASVALAMVAIYFRHMRYHMYHRERMAAIEKNLPLPEDFFELPARPLDSAYLLRGLIWLAVGIGSVIFFVVMAMMEGDKDVYAVAALGLIPIGVGIAYLVTRRHELKKAAAEATAQS